jgi:DNA primase
VERIQLTPEFVQAVRDAVSIEDLAGEHTQLKKNGRRLIGLCPFHREKTPSFSIDPEQGLYYCFGCGAGGDAIRLHQQLTGDDFPAAMESLARRYGVPLPRRSARRRETGDAGAGIERALEAAEQFFRTALESSPEAGRYLASRRIEPELAGRFALGYAPDAWQGLLDALTPRLPSAALEAAGLVARSERAGGRLYDRFRNRLMFPIRTASGALVGFGGRTLGEEPAKYINSRETPRFQKGTLLYGLDLARRSIRERGRVLLVEGYFDVLAAVDCGIDWTVASMGTALTREQVRLLGRYADEVVVGYDGDRAGEEAARKAMPLLLAEGLVVHRAAFPPGQDPDSLRLDEGVEAVRAVVDGAEDAVLREIGRLPLGLADSPTKQAEAARETRALLAAVRDRTLAYGYGRRAAERLGLPVDLLWREDRSARPSLAGIASREVSGDRGRRPPAFAEERCLQLLLAEPVQRLHALRLPAREAFLHAESRVIYEAVLQVLAEESPDDGELGTLVRSVLARLPAAGGAIDRLAELLLQDSVQPGASELLDALRVLERRYFERRNKELANEVRAAQREGDEARLERLLREKAELSRQLHRGSADPEQTRG